MEKKKYSKPEIISHGLDCNTNLVLMSQGEAKNEVGSPVVDEFPFVNPLKWFK